VTLKSGVDMSEKRIFSWHCQQLNLDSSVIQSIAGILLTCTGFRFSHAYIIMVFPSKVRISLQNENKLLNKQNLFITYFLLNACLEIKKDTHTIPCNSRFFRLVRLKVQTTMTTRFVVFWDLKEGN
jgi:hypothetical protein